MPRARRPPLYALEAAPRRRRRLRWRPRVRIGALARGLVLAAVLATAAAGAYAAWRVWPLTDRSAGVIAAGTAAPPPARGHPYRLSTAGASHARIPGVDVSAGLVADGAGRVVWMRRPHRSRAVASLTKLMTALLVPHPSARRRVAVTRAMLGVPGYGIALRRGQRPSVRELVAAALVASANDAATALAVHRSGSVAGFVRLMNRTARRWRLRDTRYSNPSGIYDQGNRSSAWDTALLVHRLLARPALARLAATRVYPASTSLQLVNTNRLLWTYRGAIGVKTGFTSAAGRCLALAARHGRRLVIAVALDVRGDEWRAGRRLLDFGFRHWRG